MRKNMPLNFTIWMPLFPSGYRVNSRQATLLFASGATRSTRGSTSSKALPWMMNGWKIPIASSARTILNEQRGAHQRHSFQWTQVLSEESPISSAQCSADYDPNEEITCAILFFYCPQTNFHFAISGPKGGSRYLILMKRPTIVFWLCASCGCRATYTAAGSILRGL